MSDFSGDQEAQAISATTKKQGTKQPIAPQSPEESNKMELFEKVSFSDSKNKK
jgi:hypothetical protein